MSDTKKKLFIPRRLSGEDNRYTQWNKGQPIVDGKPINQYTHDGKKTGIWEEYHNGKLWSKGPYKDDIAEGEWEWYWTNGNLHTKGLYKDGNREDIWETYWFNGKLEEKGSFKDDLKDGIWEEYDISGNLVFKGLYKDDELVKILPLYESKTPSFLLKEEMGLIREGNVQDYINNVISKIKNLPYETKKKYLTIAISTLLGYTSYPTIQTIFNNLPDKEVKEIVHKIMKKKDKKSIFNDGTKLRLSEKGFRHIMDEEQPKLVAYSLGDGKITIGYGHAEPVETTKLKVGDKITKEQAKIYLKEDLKIAADGVRRMFRDWKKQNKNYKVTQDMFDALVSMAFNMGVSGLRNTTFVDYLRDGNYKTAGRLIKQTKINNDTFPGLEKRRNRESDMFLSYLSKNNKINV
jgi:GH24 family phage-related lysozyme (muramidase)